MRYSQIRSLDISNGEGVGIALFVQGCHFHCDGCFNKETWDFNGGKEWTEKEKDLILSLLKRPYINRISILGGEPLADENLHDVYDLILEIRKVFGFTKKIWIYTGYSYCDIPHSIILNKKRDEWNNDEYRSHIIFNCDVLIDGKYEKDKKVNGKWYGSYNQHLRRFCGSLKGDDKQNGLHSKV